MRDPDPMNKLPWIIYTKNSSAIHLIVYVGPACITAIFHCFCVRRFLYVSQSKCPHLHPLPTTNTVLIKLVHISILYLILRISITPKRTCVYWSVDSIVKTERTGRRIVKDGTCKSHSEKYTSLVHVCALIPSPPTTWTSPIGPWCPVAHMCAPPPCSDRLIIWSDVDTSPPYSTCTCSPLLFSDCSHPPAQTMRNHLRFLRCAPTTWISLVRLKPPRSQMHTTALISCAQTTQVAPNSSVHSSTIHKCSFTVIRPCSFPQSWSDHNASTHSGIHQYTDLNTLMAYLSCENSMPHSPVCTGTLVHRAPTLCTPLVGASHISTL